MGNNTKGEKRENNLGQTTTGKYGIHGLDSNHVLSSASDKDLLNSQMIFENRIPCEWLDTQEAADYLRMSVNALRIRVHRGQIRIHRIGRRIRFKVDELRVLLSTKGA